MKINDCSTCATNAGGVMSRRELLGRMSAGFGMLGLAGLLGQEASGAVGRHHAATAKRVIFLFLNGGPSHVDTFDPKPALKAHAGEKPAGERFRETKGSTGF